MKKIFFLFSNFLFLTTFLFAQQSKIDSLLNILKTTKEDTNKIILVGSLAWELKNINPDTSILLVTQTLQLVEKLNWNIGKAKSYHLLGVFYYIKGDYTLALDNYQKALTIWEKLKDSIGTAKTLGNIGVVYWIQGNYSKALDYYFKDMKITEQSGDKNAIASNNVRIGLVFWNQMDLPKALNYCLKGLKIYEEIKDKNGLANAMGNIGLVYDEMGDLSIKKADTAQANLNYDTALNYCIKSVKLYEELERKRDVGLTYGNIGSIYKKQNEYSKAIDYLSKALTIAEEIGEKNRIVLWMAHIGSLYLKQKIFNQAEKYLLQAVSLSEKINTLNITSQIHQDLAQLYNEKGNYKSAFEHFQQYSIAKDSIFNEQSQKQITEMQTKYETEKKEQQIKLLNKDKEIQTKDLERQKTIRNAVAGGLILVLLFSFVLINRLLLIRKQKKIIEVEREKSEKLLLNILPKDTADELKRNNAVTPKRYDQVTVMFTDFKGFTTIAEKMSAEELVSELDFIFKKFDEIISKYPIEKIKTIGDAYMCAGGLPVANTTNPRDVVMAGLEIQGWMISQNKWQLRLGVHTGSVIAGVVGDKKFAYDIWGDAVNTASRMESSGEAGKVNISGSTYKNLQGFENLEGLKYTLRGKIPAKNKGEIEMYFVERIP